MGGVPLPLAVGVAVLSSLKVSASVAAVARKTSPKWEFPKIGNPYIVP